MGTKYFFAVEKWTSLLAATLIGLALLVLSLRAAFSLAFGAGLMVANAMALRYFADRLRSAVGGRPGLIVLLFNLKMLLLIGLIGFAVRYLHVAPLPFIVGISILPVAIVIVAVQHSLTPAAPPKDDIHG